MSRSATRPPTKAQLTAIEDLQKRLGRKPGQPPTTWARAEARIARLNELLARNERKAERRLKYVASPNHEIRKRQAKARRAGPVVKRRLPKSRPKTRPPTAQQLFTLASLQTRLRVEPTRPATSAEAAEEIAELQTRLAG